MSLTSTGGGFELTSFSGTRNIFAGRNQVPSTASVSFAIKNNNSFAIESCGISFGWFYRTTSGDANLVASDSYLHGNSSASGSASQISWASGSSKSFSGSVGLLGNVYSTMYGTPTVDGTLQVSPTRGCGIEIIIVYQRYVNGTLRLISERIRLTQEETDKRMPVWIKPFTPSIEVNAVRYDSTTGVPSDEGEKILVAVKMNKRGVFSASDMISAGYPSTLAVSLGKSGTAHPQGSTTITLAQCINGIYEFAINSSGEATRLSGPSIYTGTVSNSEKWVLSVGFVDSYEPCSATVEIDEAFANVHLSEYPEGGVCFGGFSKSAELGKALFENYYPSRLYGGIEQIGSKNADGSLWNELAPASTSITTPGTYGDILQIRRIENKCIIKGSVMIKPGSSTTTIAVLPEAYKPLRCTYRLNGCQGARIARVAVHGTEGTNYGELVLEWVYNIGGENAGSQFTSNAIWVDCAIEYWID